MIRIMRTCAALLAAVGVTAFCACDCSRGKDNALPFEKTEGATDGFSAHFIDVGSGDATLLRFPDGKIALIDCGNAGKNGETLSLVKKYLDFYAVNGIDYFILSHPDLESVGNAEEIIKSYSVKKIIAPKTLNPERYPIYNRALIAAKERGIKTEISQTLKSVVGENYALLFLSPDSFDLAGGPYDDYNGNSPNATAINNVAPILYVECFGVRFFIAGDANADVQRTVYDNILSGYYDGAVKGVSPKFDEIDFFKVAKHGLSDGVCDELWGYLKCKNAIIASNPEGGSGAPSDTAIYALTNDNRACGIWRTDTVGGVSVFVSKNGTKTVTQK